MTQDERDPRSGQGRGSDEDGYDFDADDNGRDPIWASALWEGRYPEVPNWESAWRLVDFEERSKTRQWCHRLPMRGGEKTTGRRFSFNPGCNSWTCPVCAPGRAEKAVKHLAWRFNKVEEVWFTRFLADPGSLERLRQRRYARNRTLPGDERVKWVSVYRIESESITQIDGPLTPVAYHFTTHRLGGRDAPSDPLRLTPPVALYLLATVALRLPSVHEVHGKEGWGIPGKDSSGPSTAAVFFGVHPETRWNRANQAAADTSSARYGVKVAAHDDALLPGEVPVTEHFDHIVTALDALRPTSREVHEGDEEAET